MAYTQTTVGSAWPASATYTASGTEELDIINPSGGTMFFLVNATAPTIEPTEGSPIKARDHRAITLLDGEKLWVASMEESATCTILY